MDGIEYRVQSGDTLSSIARRHQVTEAVLSRLNGISDVNRIWAGQVLRIPKERPCPTPRAPVHKVCAGETLSGIAEHYHRGPSEGQGHWQPGGNPPHQQGLYRHGEARHGGDGTQADRLRARPLPGE
ncbi:LysM peptidoglycan-binding domain-containing protein [Stigmatella aurantiaca]|uniref:Glycoside Hydrolase Family 25 n=1 Tax=Stigmatella aurantiaca (strain DW4/3-1) TaxID=378806 RepID=Q09AI8_STIAD|nr:LysM peptidoglycan-binding domain-containing protein [Stigmatella aurantiaca]EAU68694.1 glycoside Hydrolase Family 25 [Stigmatella aurantiaca DW4/3-1]